MGLFNLLGKSLGLLGKPYVAENKERKFGSAPEYVMVQMEAPSYMEFNGLNGGQFAASEGSEFVLMFTKDEFIRASERADENPEDVEEFLRSKALQDSVD